MSEGLRNCWNGLSTDHHGNRSPWHSIASDELRKDIDGNLLISNGLYNSNRYCVDSCYTSVRSANEFMRYLPRSKVTTKAQVGNSVEKTSLAIMPRANEVTEISSFRHELFIKVS